MPAPFRLILTIYTFFIYTTFALSSQSEDVLSRLSAVETKTGTIQKENEELRLENRQLREENAELRKHVLHIEIEFQFHKEEFSVMKERLTKTERYILTSKSVEDSQQMFKDKTPGEVSDQKSEALSKLGKEEHGDFKRTVSNLQNEKSRSDARTRIQTGSSKEDIYVQNWQRRGFKRRTKSKRLLMPVITTTTAASKVDIGSHVSFSAHMGGGMAGLGTNQILKFEIVNNNEGGAYNKLSGMFTCTVSGTYFFTATIFSRWNEEVYASIMVNNVLKASVGSDGRNNNNDSGTNSLIIHCDKGGMVWVRHDEPSHGTNIRGDHYSHFGGFLLWRDDN